MLLGIFVLGPLGGVTASYMNFSLGFFVGGQLAGILRSAVTYGYGYGAEGRHSAKYIQTAAASGAAVHGGDPQIGGRPSASNGA